ncbi:MAG: hypothetical protein OEV59_01895 [Deltaproteobacteria bacterium]|nr:hypothetical protein [Deltaproteobacteria bacterium]
MKRVTVCILIFAAVFGAAYRGMAADDFVVIVNRKGPFASGVTADTVKKIFLGEKRFEGGVTLMPVNMQDGSLKEAFLGKVVGMTQKDYKLHWVKKVFREGIDVPPTLHSSYEAVELVQREKGAIAYVPASVASFAEGVVALKL